MLDSFVIVTLLLHLEVVDEGSALERTQGVGFVFECAHVQYLYSPIQTLLFDYPPHHPHCSLDYWRYACLPHSFYKALSKPTGQGQPSNISLWSAHAIQ